MSVGSQQDGGWEQKRATNPLMPLIGFIALVGLGGFSFLVAPSVRNWLRTGSLVLLNRRLVPMQLPAWSDIALNGVIALVIFLILFGLVMTVAMIAAPPRRLDDRISKQLAHEQKARKKRRGY